MSLLLSVPSSFHGKTPGPGVDWPAAANHDFPFTAIPERRLIAWLFRVPPQGQASRPYHDAGADYDPRDDWQTVASLCGYHAEDFKSAGAALPLTAVEIDHFRQNHRGTDRHINRDFLAAKSGLPSPLAELYGLYQYRARLDTEATLFVAQTTGSIRVASVIADLLAMGGFAQGHEAIHNLTMTYAISAAFDTSALIDRTNQEALRRLTLPADHPAHLLKLSPDDISLLATNLATRNMMNSADLLEKANLLAEARQDVARLPRERQFAVALAEGDLPLAKPWVGRIQAAYGRLLKRWQSSPIPTARVANGSAPL